jgi:hypothetical protein
MKDAFAISRRFPSAYRMSQCSSQHDDSLAAAWGQIQVPTRFIGVHLWAAEAHKYVVGAWHGVSISPMKCGKTTGHRAMNTKGQIRCADPAPGDFHGQAEGQPGI